MVWTTRRCGVDQLKLPASFEGKSVLDIGAWDGFFSFEAERRGAAQVLATDYFAWHGVGWGTGRGKAGFELARRALGSRVEDQAIDVIELSPDRIGQFDVVFFLGVLYHLPNPLAALERVASVCRQQLILETVVDMIGVRRPAVAFYPGGELSNVRRTGGRRAGRRCTVCCAGRFHARGNGPFAVRRRIAPPRPGALGERQELVQRCATPGPRGLSRFQVALSRRRAMPAGDWL